MGCDDGCGSLDPEPGPDIGKKGLGDGKITARHLVSGCSRKKGCGKFKGTGNALFGNVYGHHTGNPQSNAEYQQKGCDSRFLPILRLIRRRAGDIMKGLDPFAGE
jgi:hypothetical protein